VFTPHGMLAQIPLTDDERAAVEDGSAAVERLLERLANTPTPAGRTPREVEQSPRFIPLTSLTVSAATKEALVNTHLGARNENGKPSGVHGPIQT
jgi:hypothetical protein